MKLPAVVGEVEECEGKEYKTRKKNSKWKFMDENSVKFSIFPPKNCHDIVHLRSAPENTIAIAMWHKTIWRSGMHFIKYWKKRRVKAFSRVWMHEIELEVTEKDWNMNLCASHRVLNKIVWVYQQREGKKHNFMCDIAVFVQMHFCDRFFY